jgi:hypothetical protein
MNLQSEIARMEARREAMRPRIEAYSGPPKLVTVNGHTREIQEPWLTDEEVAGQVRMLLRSDLDHERVCTLARDRILYLSAELAKAREALSEK